MSRIASLQHITHVDNLEAILECGLVSRHRALSGHCPTEIADASVNGRRNRPDPIHGRSLYSYVPTYFNAENAMLYTLVNKGLRQDLCILHIDTTPLYRDGSIFTDGNAACSDTTFFEDTENLRELNWPCIEARYWSGFEDGKRQRMAEALVQDCIPPRFIHAIRVDNRAVAHKVCARLGSNRPTITARGFFQ